MAKANPLQRRLIAGVKGGNPDDYRNADVTVHEGTGDGFLGSAGNVLRSTAPVLGAAAGFATGGPAGALAGYGAGKNMKDEGITFGSAAKAGAALGAGKLLGEAAKRIPGVSKIGDAARDLLPSGVRLPSFNGGGDLLDKAGDFVRDKVMGGNPITLGGIGDRIGEGVGKVVDTVRERPELALAAAQGAYGVSRAGAADDARKTALGIASRGWDERDPLRRAGVAGMLNTTRPALPEFSDPTNPFAQGSTATASAPEGVDPALLLRGRKRPMSMRG